MTLPPTPRSRLRAEACTASCGAKCRRARKQAVLDGQSVEVYSEGRFFCMTGKSHRRNGTPISDAQPQLEQLCARLKAAARRAVRRGTKLGVGEGRNNELTRRLGIEVAKGVTGVELASERTSSTTSNRRFPRLRSSRFCAAPEVASRRGRVRPCHEAAHAEVLKVRGSAATAGRARGHLAALDRARLEEGRPNRRSWPPPRRRCATTTAGPWPKQSRGRRRAPARPAPGRLPLRQRPRRPRLSER